MFSVISQALLLLFSHSVVSHSFGTPWTVARQAPLSMDFSSQDTGVGCHFLLQEIFPTQGSLGSPALAGEFFTTIYILIKEKYNIILEIFTSTVKSHKILLLLCLIDIQNHHFHPWIHIGKYQYFPILLE